MIKITSNGVCARAQRLEPLTSGMVGAKVAFALSPEFDGLTVTAVFTNGAVTKDVLNPGDECFIPPEVLETAGKTVKVGIYAVRGSELVIPTVYAPIGVVLPGADPSGDTSTSAALPVWAQIESMIGSLDDLTTESKNNLVDAINEAAQSGGGASISMRVDGGYIQYSTDEGKTWVNLIAKAELKGDKGDDGITPHIGDNGNWYIGSTDTGKPSRGEQGPKGADGHTPVKGTDYWTASDKTEVVAEAAAAVDLTPYAKKTEVPTKTSQLTNDSGFLTSHQDISGKQDKLIAGENITIASDGKTISATGGGAEALIVAITDNNGTLSADKTFIEIKDAIAAGTSVFVDYGGTGLPLITLTADALYFGTIQCDSGDATTPAAVATTMIEITPNGEVNDFSAQIDIPKTLPNPNAITFTGVVTGSYDGSAPLSVNIPTVPTKTSQLTNDSGYLTLATLPKYGGESE